MNDKELLELAAKAAQIMVNPWHEKYGLLLSDFDFEPWNPLTDDGDALRLAVKLLFEIDFGLGSIAIRHSTGIKIIEAYNNDPYAATRRAIVRAAAEIGKEMK
jgi:hypothetical protein